MSIWALAWIVATLPHPSADVARYDVLIRNRVYREDGSISLDQVGGLDLVDGEEYWQWWRLASKTGPVIRCEGGYLLRWRDEKTKRIQVVSAPAYTVRETLEDLEIENRKLWPEHKRRGLK